MLALQFLSDAVGACVLSDVYGVTEIGAIARGGLVVDWVVVKLRDVPELGYFAADGVGEVLVKKKAGQHGRADVWFDRYHRREPETRAAFDGAFYCTGDVGRLELIGGLRGRHQQQRLTLIDRIKHVFKLAQGEFVAPSKLEALYAAAVPVISQCFVSGRADQTNVVAVVVLDTAAPPGTSAASVLAAMRGVAKGREIPPYEIPAAVHIEPTAWEPGTGLTAS